MVWLISWTTEQLITVRIGIPKMELSEENAQIFSALLDAAPMIHVILFIVIGFFSLMHRLTNYKSQSWLLYRRKTPEDLV